MRFVPQCEVLEARLVLDAAHPIPMRAGIVGPALAYERPPVNIDGGLSITSMSASEGEHTPQGVWWTIYGTCSGDYFLGTVRFSSTALPEWQGQSTAIQSDGSFSIAVRCATTEEGVVTGVAWDAGGQNHSNEASDYLKPT